MKPKIRAQDPAGLGEKGLLRALTQTWKVNPKIVLTGVGDDCAVLRGCHPGHYQIFKTDAVVEGAHFLPEAKPEWIGHKALARALSDLAAMGATPVAAVVTIGFPLTEKVARLRAIYRGLEKLAFQHKVELVGGETTRASQLFLNIALLGECKGYAPVLRSTARAGDLLYVTGHLGGTQKRHHLIFAPRLAEGEWLARKKIARAMMDLSDGLGADLPRLAEASGLDYCLNLNELPRRKGVSEERAMNEGEDYELLFTVPSQVREMLHKKWPFDTPIKCIGYLTRCDSVKKRLEKYHGFDHFTKR